MSQRRSRTICGAHCTVFSVRRRHLDNHFFRGGRNMKSGGRAGRSAAARVSFFAAVLASISFFLAGFLASSLLSSPDEPSRPSRFLESADDGGDSDLPLISTSFQILSWKPRALYFPNFASSEQCETIIKMAKAHLKPSTLALRKGETAENTKGVRTSSGTFISSSEDKTGILKMVEKKIAEVTTIPTSHGEAFNVLRYEIGQRYLSHYDVFNPAEYGPQKSQRIASFLLYLSDVEEGGETMFPFENGQNMDIGYDYKECIGLKVKPQRGDGLLFYSIVPNGTIDLTSLHGSCPVIKGEKWVATKWIRNQEQD